jgi:hypothetical protein
MWPSGDAPNKVYKGYLLNLQVESKWFICGETGMSILYLISAKLVAFLSTPFPVKGTLSLYKAIKLLSVLMAVFWGRL